jgi:Protein of unknown function (DUF2934)
VEPFPPESVEPFPGITGYVRSESVDTFDRNQWSLWPGIRTIRPSQQRGVGFSPTADPDVFDLDSVQSQGEPTMANANPKSSLREVEPMDRQPAAGSDLGIWVQTDTSKQIVSHEDIAVRAYALYESRGGEDGHDLDDWLQAERELLEEMNR